MTSTTIIQFVGPSPKALLDRVETLPGVDVFPEAGRVYETLPEGQISSSLEANIALWARVYGLNPDQVWVEKHPTHLVLNEPDKSWYFSRDLDGNPTLDLDQIEDPDTVEAARRLRDYLLNPGYRLED